MSKKDLRTEEIIKETAKRIFFKDGKLHATTQDIADEAGVNRTLLNYYFRSRDALFDQVFTDAQADMSIALDKVIVSDLPFQKKIEKLVDVFLSQAIEYPYKEMFIVMEINKHSEHIRAMKKDVKIKKFLAEIEAEMNKGTIVSTDPRHFLMNLFSLMAYPLIAGQIYKALFNTTNQDYDELMKERKKVICEMIFKS